MSGVQTEYDVSSMATVETGVNQQDKENKNRTGQDKTRKDRRGLAESVCQKEAQICTPLNTTTTSVVEALIGDQAN